MKIPFEERYPIYIQAVKKYWEIRTDKKLRKINPVPVFMAFSEKDILDKHDIFLSRGYEGIVIRRLGRNPFGPIRELTTKEREQSRYITRRGVNMYKYKGGDVDFEAVIIGGFEGTGTEKGAVVYNLRDSVGREFNARPRGTMEERRYIFEHISNYIGHMVVVRVPKDGFTDSGMPRFPVVIRVL